ncbi:hypothetical protein TNCV_1818781 [Trichonephila clavipes]|nr:hypothetical protein TNCV_1818781 [Trichonephila clavipes]
MNKQGFQWPPNQTVQKIKDFLRFVLLPYTEDGSAHLKTNYHSLPMILSVIESSVVELSEIELSFESNIIGLDSKPGEGIDVCKCIMLLWQGGILNSSRATSPLMGLVEGEERWEAPDHPQGFHPPN